MGVKTVYKQRKQRVSIEFKVSMVESGVLVCQWRGGEWVKDVYKQRVSIEVIVSVAESGVCVCVWGGGGERMGHWGGVDGGRGVEEVGHVYKQSKSTSSASTHRADALASNHFSLSIISWGSEVVQCCFGS